MFGFFGVFDRFGGAIGSFVFGVMLAATGSSRPAILSLIVFFALGACLLSRVDVERGRRLAREAEAAAHEAAARLTAVLDCTGPGARIAASRRAPTHEPTALRAPLACRPRRWPLALLPGCSIRSIAVNKIGDALAGDGLELRLRRRPRARRRRHPLRPQDHGGPARESPRSTRGCCSRPPRGFVQYAYGWVQMDGRHGRGDGPRPGHGAARAGAASSTCGRATTACAASRWTSRASREALARDPKAALARTRKEHVPLLYWTAMGWAGAMSLKVNDSERERRPADRRGARPARARARRGLGPRLDPRVLHQLGGGPLVDRRARWSGRASTSRRRSPSRRAAAPSRTSPTPRA